MKNNLIFTIIIIAMMTASVRAQSDATNFEVTPSVGYMFNGAAQFAEGVVDFENSVSFGIAASARLNVFADLEFDYTWAAQTGLEFESNGLFGNADISTTVNIHHLTLNLNNYLRPSKQFRPFINIGAGAAIYAVDGGETRGYFALTTGLGGKFYINEKIGIRLQGRLLAPLYYEGADYYPSIETGGTDPGLTLNATVALMEFDLRTGIIIRL